ncbi:MAG: tetratricopeptide repeat protein [Candidatus Odinarchaeota archaeon]
MKRTANPAFIDETTNIYEVRSLNEGTLIPEFREFEDKLGNTILDKIRKNRDKVVGADWNLKTFGKVVFRLADKNTLKNQAFAHMVAISSVFLSDWKILDLVSKIDYPPVRWWVLLAKAYRGFPHSAYSELLKLYEQDCKREDLSGKLPELEAIKKRLAYLNGFLLEEDFNQDLLVKDDQEKPTLGRYYYTYMFSWKLILQTEYSRASEILNTARKRARLECNNFFDALFIHCEATIKSFTGNYDETKEDFYRAIEIREKIGDIIGVFSSYSNLGNLYFSLSDTEKWLESVKKALNYVEKTETYHFYYLAALSLAGAYETVGEIDLARKTYLKALKTLKKHESTPLHYFTFRRHQALWYKNRGDTSKSLELLQMLEKEARESGAEKNIVNMVNRDVALHKMDAGNFTRAVEILLNIVESSKSVVNQRIDETEQVKRDLGELYIRSGDYGRAKEIFSELECEFEAKNRHLDLHYLYYQIAKLHNEQGDALNARNYILKAKKSFLSENILSPVTWRTLGEASLLTGNMDEAERCFQQSKAIFEKQQNRSYSYGKLLLLMGQLKMFEGNVRQSAKFLKEAEIQSEQIKSPSLLATIKLKQGILSQEEDNIGLARQFYEKALTLASGIGQKKTVVEASIRLADIELRKYVLEFDEKRLKEARKLLDNALKTLEYMDAPILEVEILLVQSYLADCLFDYTASIRKAEEALKISKQHSLALRPRTKSFLQRMNKKYGDQKSTADYTLLEFQEYLKDCLRTISGERKLTDDMAE